MYLHWQRRVSNFWQAGRVQMYDTRLRPTFFSPLQFMSKRNYDHSHTRFELKDLYSPKFDNTLHQNIALCLLAFPPQALTSKTRGLGSGCPTGRQAKLLMYIAMLLRKRCGWFNPCRSVDHLGRMVGHKVSNIYVIPQQNLLNTITTCIAPPTNGNLV